MIFYADRLVFLFKKAERVVYRLFKDKHYTC